MLAVGMRGFSHSIAQDMVERPDSVRSRNGQGSSSTRLDFPKDLEVKMFQGTFILSGAPELSELNEAVLTQWRENLGVNVTLTPIDASSVRDAQVNREMMEYHLDASTRNSTEPLITTRARYFKDRYNQASFEEIQAQTRADSGQHRRGRDRQTQRGALQVHPRQLALHVPLTTNPLFFGVVSEKVADWKPTIGAPWPHYFEYIEAVR